jgi:predicted enzyme related to lactoylglutathione lyase
MAVESWVPVAADSADDIVIKVESVGGSVVIQKALGLGGGYLACATEGNVFVMR